MELGSVTLKRIGFFCFPIKHSTHTEIMIPRNNLNKVEKPTALRRREWLTVTALLRERLQPFVNAVSRSRLYCPP